MKRIAIFVVIFLFWTIAWTSFDSWADSKIDKESLDEFLGPNNPNPSLISELTASIYMMVLAFGVPAIITESIYHKTVHNLDDA